MATAAEAARVRGTGLGEAAKSILFKVDGTFGLFVLRADLELSSRALRHSMGARRTRFASRAELAELTGLPPGSVPPFGEPVLPFPLHADPSVMALDSVVFTAGSRSTSLRLAGADYRRLARPRVVELARSPTAS